MSETSDAVGLLYQDYVELVSDLRMSPSGLSSLNRSYHKHLLVAAASSLEDKVKALVPEIFSRHGTERLAAFVAKQVMARGYHTLFEWKSGTAQGFFTSFGDVCGQTFKAALKTNDQLKAQHAAFMQLGQLRNQVVHNDYASALIELTPREIIDRYNLALEFVDQIEIFVLAEA